MLAAMLLPDAGGFRFAPDNNHYTISLRRARRSLSAVLHWDVTLSSLQRAAAMVGRRVMIELV